MHELVNIAYPKSRAAESSASAVAKGAPGSGAFSLLIVAVVVFACLFLFRLPTILWPRELNVDEGQMLSQGMKFLIDPIPWRAVDGTSGGPLNSYLISIFLLLGVKPGYALAHVLATALVSLQVVTAHQTILHVASRKAAHWGILPMMICYSFSSNINYLHYASELLPALLLALGFHSFVMWMDDIPERRQSTRILLVFLSGLAIGAAPWCKLQALPIAVVVGGVSLLGTIYRGTQDTARKFQDSVALCAGVLLPAFLILRVVVHAGVIKDFWCSYVLGNISYAGEGNWRTILVNFSIAHLLPEIMPLFAGCLIALILFSYQSRKKQDLVMTSRDVWIFGSLLLWLGAAFFAVCRPPRFFAHYTIFLIYPMSCFSAGLLAKEVPLLMGKFTGFLNRASKIGIVVILAILSFSTVFQAVEARALPPEDNPNEKIAGVIKEINGAHAIRSLAIWGWTPEVYVLTGIPPATRDSIGHFVITPGQMQPYFRHRFACDLRSAMPDLFVDTVAPGAFTWSWKTGFDGYESDREMRDLIDRRYYLVRELVLIPGQKPVRFFARRGTLPIAFETPVTM
jgi:hypothetical protein